MGEQIDSTRMTYRNYLQLESLLSLQSGPQGHLPSPCNDEMHFIVVHQVFELWFKLINRELEEAITLMEGKEVSEQEVLKKIKELNNNEAVSGILVQLPLPPQINKEKIINAINPLKDVDGFHPINVGNLSSGYNAIVPCTPLGCLLLIKKIESNLNFKTYYKIKLFKTVDHHQRQYPHHS